MHSANTLAQNEKIAAVLDRVDGLYKAARRRPGADRNQLAEGFAEVFWYASNERYRVAMSRLRIAERAFVNVANANDLSRAMASFTVRPEDLQQWRALEVSQARPVRLPAGTIVLVPARRGAPRTYALAA
jgi:hypothetical protein